MDRSSQLCSSMRAEYFDTIWKHNPISLWRLFFDPHPNHTPIKYRCSTKESNWITPANLSLEHLRSPNRASPNTKTCTFELHTSNFSQLCQKWPYLKYTCYLIPLFESIECLDVIKDVSSNTQHGCPWMPSMCIFLFLSFT